MRGTVAERFNEKWMPEPNSGCWLWLGSTNEHGYGQLNVDGVPVKAHRVSYRLHHELLPRLLRHKCDTPLCVNPDHLHPGTQAQNISDCVSRGRARGKVMRGADNPRAKLSVPMVLRMRELWRSGVSQSEIARATGLSQSHVSDVVTGRSWSHVGEEKPVAK